MQRNKFKGTKPVSKQAAASGKGYLQMAATTPIFLQIILWNLLIWALRSHLWDRYRPMNGS
jgi:hypothetical protein